jgi:histidinol-phosphate/aromatic aminotransferase/cobyric acid decarboxylase-like protein
MPILGSLGAVSTDRRIHGGFLHAELRTLGIEPADVLDFSVNCNPYGPCREVVEAVRSAPIDQYPDPTAREARVAIASLLGVDPAQVALGNGSSDLLWTLAHVLVRPGTGVVIVEPTFCEFRAAAERAGGRVHEWRATSSDAFAIDLQAVERLVREDEATVLYLCAPNTPTGISIPANDVAGLAEANPAVVIVLDQSFLSLSERFSDVQARLPGNVICVRSMTKDYAIPGIRVGYLVAALNIVGHVEECRAAWTTSSLAQAAAIAGCRATDFVDRSRATLLADCSALAELLRRVGLDPVPSTTGFLIVRTGGASSLRDRLLATHHILVRDCSSFGLPDYIRLAARPEVECERLMGALRQELDRC